MSLGSVCPGDRHLLVPGQIIAPDLPSHTLSGQARYYGYDVCDNRIIENILFVPQ
jgi:hypothetical protein